MTKLPQDMNDFPSLGLYHKSGPVLPAQGCFPVPDATKNMVLTQSITELVRAMTALGKAYSASIGLLNAITGTNNYPLSVFNPNTSGKDVLIYSIQAANVSGGASPIVQMVTTNPAYATQITPINEQGGGPVSALPNTSVTMTTVTQTLSGAFKQVGALAANTLELLTNGATIHLPNSMNTGVIVFLQTYAVSVNSLLIRWLEL
jgi:hypothetical protein